MVTQRGQRIRRVRALPLDACGGWTDGLRRLAALAQTEIVLTLIAEHPGADILLPYFKPEVCPQSSRLHPFGFSGAALRGVERRFHSRSGSVVQRILKRGKPLVGWPRGLQPLALGALLHSSARAEVLGNIIGSVLETVGHRRYSATPRCPMPAGSCRLGAKPPVPRLGRAEHSKAGFGNVFQHAEAWLALLQQLTCSSHVLDTSLAYFSKSV